MSSNFHHDLHNEPHGGHGGGLPINHGTVAAGTGLLTTIDGTIFTTSTVSTPISLGNGNFILADNESNAQVTAGNGDIRILELGTGAATFTLGNGNDSVTDLAGGATVTIGTGDSRISLGGTANVVTVGSTLGGTHDETTINAGSGGATVVAGNGTLEISAGGANNTITVGNGNDRIQLGSGPGGDMDGTGSASATATVTADILNLGNGSNHVFLGGSGNTIHDGSGTDTIAGAAAGNDTFVPNAAGGTVSIQGFSLTNGDKIDLTSILPGVSLSAIDASPSSYLSLTNITDPHHSTWTDSVLTVTGGGGATATVTLLNTGSLALTSTSLLGALTHA